MYIQLTTRCNMTCAHCCMNATKEGEDMSFSTFKKIIDGGHSDYAFLGGGEPTLNKDFEKMLMYALGRCESVSMVTNGSRTNLAITLAGMNQIGHFSCELSQDEYHDYIQPEVIQAFYAAGKKADGYDDRYGPDPYARYIRDTSQRLMHNGRAAENELTNQVTDPNAGYDAYDCPCDELFVKPSGKILWCGCPDAPEVDPDNLVEDFFDTLCWTKYNWTFYEDLAAA